MLNRVRTKMARVIAPREAEKTQREKRPQREDKPEVRNEPKATNAYERQLTEKQIAAGRHRGFVGGLWDEIGALQIEFLKAQGLSPHHRLVDVGCGALRGGVHFISYLDQGNYYGLDLNASLIEAGKREIESADLTSKQPNLLVNDKFEMSRFGVSFDYAIAVSVFTHLHANTIIRCLAETKKVLGPEGKLFATFFEAPSPVHLEPIKHNPGGIVTNFDADPFHYSFSEFEQMAEAASMSVEYIGDWSHPRNQKMLCITTR